MARVGTETVCMDGSEKKEFIVKFEINVDKQGIFSTTLPKETVQLLKEANIDLHTNRAGNAGYYWDATYDGLVRQIKEVGKEYVSRELIEEKIVIQYAIKTTCSYVFDKDGDIVPNAGEQWTKLKERAANDWKQGTENQNANDQHPFGFEIYAKPYHRREYRYKSGKIKVEYQRFTPFGSGTAGDEAGYYLRWLEGVTTIARPRGGQHREIDYSEEVAKVFVDMIKGVCKLNEQIAKFIEPSAIKLLSESNVKLLG